MTLRNLAHGILASSVSLLAFAAPALAQDAPDVTSANAAGDKDTAIVVTGSRIKKDPSKSALPLEIITTQTIDRNGISSPEQLTMHLTSNGNGQDNLSSNTDVTSGAQRGNNGLSSANLRGQGSGATLVLLNGRRVAAHGLSGGAVDVNQIPLAAIDRVEVLKDGASAIYGTDAIGGVINYITKKNFQGIGASGFADVTEGGGGNIYRLSAIAGYGDLDSQGFNIMFAVSYRWNEALLGSQRDFVNGNQPDRGLSINTRGTPIATAFGVGSTAFPSLLQGLTLPTPNGGNGAATTGGINILALPGGAGCNSVDGGMAYDYALWTTPNAYYACSWDTSRAASIQQPIETLTFYGRGTVALGASEAFVEVTGSKANSTKRFSNNQFSTSTSTLPIFYPYNALTQSTYDMVYNQIRAAFLPTATAAQIAALDGRYASKYPIAFRWRCMACGDRQYKTEAKTFRVAGGLQGPLPISGWDYNVGVSYATSDVTSVLGHGYYYRGTNGVTPDPRAPTAPGATQPGFVGLINSGILNPFSLTQTPQAMAGLEAVSAEGVRMFGGRYKTLQADASVSGSLFALPGGDAQLAVGVDYRRETYEFNGSDAAEILLTPNIFNAAFDNANVLTPKHRTVKAAYAELNLPIFDMLDLTGAVRVDDYSGFGSTVNPKVSAKFQPFEFLMFRGSYGTGFRVPSFNQIFNGVTESPFPGTNLADPSTCPPDQFGVQPVNNGNPGCVQINPEIWTGGNINLGPETAREYSVGVVLRPNSRWSLSADWWAINLKNTIQTLSLQELVANYSYFPERFIRNSTTNVIETVDRRYINSGARQMQGIEFALRGSVDLGRSTLAVGMDGTLLLKKREKIKPTAPFGPDLVGVFSYSGDLALKWKHNAWLTFENDKVSITLTQLFRRGYLNNKLPGIANGSVTRPGFNERVENYVTYNLSATVLALAPGYSLTLGVSNLLNTDPPFAVTYEDSSGAGGSWEPRVADPRGRSFFVKVDVKY